MKFEACHKESKPQGQVIGGTHELKLGQCVHLVGSVDLMFKIHLFNWNLMNW